MDKTLTSRYRILDTIRRKPNISRVELSELVDLSRGAVTGITQSLLDDQLIVEKPSTEGNETGRGRPRVLLSINPDAGYVLGIKLSLHQMSFSITDFKGDVVYTMQMPFRGNQISSIALDVIDMGVERCLSNAGLQRSRIAGVCVGIPGYISHETGICHWSPIFTERDVAVAGLLQERIGIETFIENDANLVTLAEQWFGKGKDLECFAVVTIEHGIGMGLVVDGRLYRGAHGIGPELGHSKIVNDGLPCRCGQFGCVEAYASDYAILNAADDSFSLDAYNENPTVYHDSITRITEKAQAGDERLISVFTEAGTRLGQGVANMIATLNPPTVIFTGGGMRAGDTLIGPAIAEATRLKLPGNQFDTEFVSHQWGDEVWARGAAALMLQHLYANVDFRKESDSSTTGPDARTTATGTA